MRGSLVAYEVEKALQDRFMQWPAADRETALRRKLVVRTFAEDPEGWEEAVVACRAHGVVLERRMLEI